MGQHLLKCSRYTLQKDLTEAVHEIHVQSLKASPKVVYPFPGGSTKLHLMLTLTPTVPVNFAVSPNKVTKMKTDLLSTETRMLTTTTTTPHVTTHKLSSEEIVTNHLSLDPTILLLKRKLYQLKTNIEKRENSINLEKENLHQLERKNIPIPQCLNPLPHPTRQKHWLEWLTLGTKSPNQARPPSHPASHFPRTSSLSAHIEYLVTPLGHPANPNHLDLEVTQLGHSTRSLN